MIGYILTEEEKDAIQEQFYAPFQVFSCAKDINGLWFIILTDPDKTKISTGMFSWVLQNPQAEYVPPILPIN